MGFRLRDTRNPTLEVVCKANALLSLPSLPCLGGSFIQYFFLSFSECVNVGVESIFRSSTLFALHATKKINKNYYYPGNI